MMSLCNARLGMGVAVLTVFVGTKEYMVQTGFAALPLAQLYCIYLLFEMRSLSFFFRIAI